MFIDLAYFGDLHVTYDYNQNSDGYQIEYQIQDFYITLQVQQWTYS